MPCVFIFFYLPYLKLNFLSIEFYRSDFKINPCQKTKKDMLSSSDSIQVLLGREQRFLLKRKKSSPTHWKMWAHRGCEWHVSSECRLEKGMLIPLQSVPTHVKCTITGLMIWAQMDYILQSYITQKDWEHIFSFPKYIYTMLSVHMPQPFPTEDHGASLKQFSFPLFTCLVRTCKLKKK